MARITIEDCIEQVPNRFQLVQMAAIRAKQLKRGASAFVDQDNKEVVTALREIAAGIVRPDEFTEAVLFSGQGDGLVPAARQSAAEAATLEAEALFSSAPAVSSAPADAETAAASGTKDSAPTADQATEAPDTEPEPAS